MDSLLNKYRPQEFSEVLGNKATLKTLQANLKAKSKVPVYVITGPTGSGKTTLARIIAKEVGGVGNDVFETAVRGIEEVRRIEEVYRFAPMWGDARVFIIDEIQHSTKDAQNELLKPLEDAPRHVYFVLCTTDPNPKKFLGTVESRCVYLSTKELTVKESRQLLEIVLKGEEEELSDSVKSLIIDKSGGLPRSIITTFASVRGCSTLAEAEEVLQFGTEVTAEVINLARAIVYSAKSWKEIGKIIKTLKEEPETIRIRLTNYCKAIMLSDYNPQKNNLSQIGKIMDCFKEPYYVSTTASASLISDCFKAYRIRINKEIAY